MSDQESAAATGVVKFSAGVVVNPEQRHSGKKEEAVTEVCIKKCVIISVLCLWVRVLFDLALWVVCVELCFHSPL